jgi:hypothetical protein
MMGVYSSSGDGVVVVVVVVVAVLVEGERACEWVSASASPVATIPGVHVS